MVDSQVEAVVPPAQGLRHVWECHRGEAAGPHSRVRNFGLRLYPAPPEFSPKGALELGRLALIQVEIMGILKDLRQPRTSPCLHCNHKLLYDVEPVLWPCNNPA